MRMLLTSEGLVNATLKQSLVDLMPSDPKSCRVAFVPTSANRLDIDKRFLLLHLRQVERVGFETFDIVDIAALPFDTAARRLRAAGVIVMGGGDTPTLSETLAIDGYAELFRELTESRVYVGISAGSIITGPDASMGGGTTLFEDKPDAVAAGGFALGLQPNHVRPHTGTPGNHDADAVIRASCFVDAPVYALDDASGITIVDGVVEPTGTGTVLRIVAGNAERVQ